MKIYIPNKNENAETVQDETETFVTKDVDTTSNSNSDNSNNSKTTVTNKKININTATQSELQTLPGIGESTALKIVTYRKENGKFSSIDDIKKVKGIGDAKFEKIKDLIMV